MATLNYKLREGRNDSFMVQLVFSYGRGKLFRKTTGIELKKREYWNNDRQRVRETTNVPEHKSYNRVLTDLSHHIISGYQELSSRGELIDNVELTNLFNSHQKNPAASKKRKGFDIIGSFKSWIEYCITTKRTRKGQKLSYGTIRTYKTTLGVLQNMEKENLQPRNEKEVSNQFYSNILSHCSNKEYSDGYSGKVVKNVKTFLKYMVRERGVEFPNYRPEDFVVLKPEAEDIYLTVPELMKIYFLDLSAHKPILSRARDLFLISAFTGLRISDNRRLSDSNIREGTGSRMFSITSKKTGSKVVVPIPDVVEKILERNDGIPESLPDQTINRLIKEIGELAGLDDKVWTSRTVGGRTTRTEHMKFELIKTHTARRSFCTNAYLADVSTLDIMALSGHKSETSFLRYIKVTQEEHADRISKHAFFESLRPDEHGISTETELKAV
jgi:integrase